MRKLKNIWNSPESTSRLLAAIKSEEYSERARNFPPEIRVALKEGKKLFRQKQFGEAKKIFLATIKQCQESAEAFEYVGRCFCEEANFLDRAGREKQGKRKELQALPYFFDALYLDENRLDSNLHLGIIYNSFGRKTLAEFYMMRAVEISRETGDTINFILANDCLAELRKPSAEQEPTEQEEQNEDPLSFFRSFLPE